MGLCKFKDALGKPKEGIHSYRIFNIAIMDVIFTFILAYIISLVFNMNYLISLLLTFILGFVLHYLFCVDTTINTFVYDLFKNKDKLNSI